MVDFGDRHGHSMVYWKIKVKNGKNEDMYLGNLTEINLECLLFGSICGNM